MADHHSLSRAVAWGSSDSGADGPRDARLLRLFDACLAGCIVLVPFVMGGRQALGQLLLVTLAFTAAVTWAVRQGLRSRPGWRPAWSAMGLFTAAAGLVLLQVLPLPASWLARIAPRTFELLPLWSSETGEALRLGVWRTISLSPAESQSGLALLLAYAMVFFVAVQRIRAVEDAERLLRWCGAAAALMAAFGLLQFLTTNGKFYWCYEHPYSQTYWSAKGSFTNANHFAQFLALGIGPLVWWMQHGSRARKSSSRHSVDKRQNLQAVVLIGAVVLVLLAGLLSFSRGGAVAIFVAVAVITVACYRAGSPGVRIIAGLAVGFMLIGCLSAVLGYERLENRLSDLTSASLDRLDRGAARRLIWRTVARAIPHHLAMGSGVGTHRELYPAYLAEPVEQEVDFAYAENSYLQVALEAGVPGVLLALAAIGLCATWCIRGLRGDPQGRRQVMLGAIAAGLAANAAHAAVDFVWYVPGCMVIVAVLAACAFRLSQLGRSESERAHSWSLPRPVAWTAAAILCLLGTWMIAGRVGPVFAEPAWQRYLLARMAERSPSTAADEQPDSPEALRRIQVARIDVEKQRIAELETVVRWQPDHAWGHVELAGAWARLFGMAQETGANCMSLSDVRDAAIQSHFPARQDLEKWLARAVGEHWAYLDQSLRHAQAGLALCPLRGQGYLHLAELCFLNGGDDTAKAAYLDQAVRLRPQDGSVMYQAGLQAWREGKLGEWLDYWQRSFKSGPTCRQTIIRQLIRHAPIEGQAQIVDFLLQEFQPDLDSLKVLHAETTERALPEDLVPFRIHYARALVAEAQTLQCTKGARVWLDAQEVYTALGDTAKALDAAQAAQKCDPNNYDVHYRLALCLINDGQYPQAETHIRWCAQRRGNNGKLQQAYQQALRGRLDGESRPAGAVEETASRYSPTIR